MIIRQKMDAMVAMENPLAAGIVCSRMRNAASGRGRKVTIGMGAYNRMPAALKSMLDAALKDAAKKKKCRISDLIWKIGLYKGETPAISIKKRPQIEVRLNGK